MACRPTARCATIEMMFVEMKVHVPTDRVLAFQQAMGQFAVVGTMPDPDPGSDTSSWTQASVHLGSTQIVGFYRALAHWLNQAAQPAPTQPAMTGRQLEDSFRRIPRVERELLKLFGDDGGRTVGWTEIRAKFALSGAPTLRTMLPNFVAECDNLTCGVPLEMTGTDDEAVFWLPLDLALVVSRLQV